MFLETAPVRGRVVEEILVGMEGGGWGGIIPCRALLRTDEVTQANISA